MYSSTLTKRGVPLEGFSTVHSISLLEARFHADGRDTSVLHSQVPLVMLSFKVQVLVHLDD